MDQQKEALYLPISIVLAAVIIGGAILTQGGVFQNSESGEKPSATSPQAQEGKIPEAAQAGPNFTITSESHIRGNPEAKVTIVEFSDFQCPFCSRFHSTLQQILANYPDKVQWVFKHFPLDQLHSEARSAAEASECIYEQRGNDGFWQFVDGVFENQARIGSDLYKELASRIGVNTAQFQDCVASRKYQEKVNQDYQEGLAAGVQGTPASFVSGKEVSGAVPYATLEMAVKGVLEGLQR